MRVYFKENEGLNDSDNPVREFLQDRKITTTHKGKFDNNPLFRFTDEINMASEFETLDQLYELIHIIGERYMVSCQSYGKDVLMEIIEKDDF